MPIDTYFSGLPREYLSHSGARLNMFVNLQAAEDYDGYQYIQILADQLPPPTAAACSWSTSVSSR